MTKEAIKLMVHEMEYVLDCVNNHVVPFDGDDFHEALRLGKEALAKQEQSVSVGEPVAWMTETGSVWRTREKNTDIPLYTSPQQRPSRSDMTWVGLTPTDMEELSAAWWRPNENEMALIDWVEAKLREKNSL